MKRLLLVLADLHPNALARQAFLLARHLPADGLELCVAVLGTSTPWVEALREQGRRVETLGWRRPFDVAPFLGLRRLLQTFRPSVIHAWGPLALRGLTLAGGAGRARLLLSGQLPPGTSTGNIRPLALASFGPLDCPGTGGSARL